MSFTDFFVIFHVNALIIKSALFFLMKPHKVKLIAPSPPFGVTLSPARERKLHLASEKKRTPHKAQLYRNSKSTALAKNKALHKTQF